VKTYFITGGEGFIGYHLSRELVEDPENRIVIYDALKHYIPLDKSNWTAYLSYRTKTLNGQQVIRIRGDMTDRGLLKETLEKYKPQIIFHLAALPIAYVCNDYPEEAKLNILDSTLVLLDVLREVSFQLERLIYTSSSMVYGDFQRDGNGQIIPAREDQECQPIDLYGAMKLSGEHVLKAYARRFSIPYTIIRPSAVYGPTDCNQRVTEIFLNNALKAKTLELDQGGNHQLDFTYVKDLVKGFLLAASSQKAMNQTFNITRGEGKKIRELAEIVAQLIPGTQIREAQREVYRPNRGSLDISKAKELLGYEPQYSLEEGMKEYLHFVQNGGFIK